MNPYLPILLLAALPCAALPLPAQEARPVRQILHGSQQTLDVFWLKSDAERVTNGVCLNDDGTFLVTDQDGHWTPKNRINRVKPGGFCGNT